MEDENKSAFVIAYMFVGLSGAFVGLLLGLVVGFVLWH